MPFCQGAGVRGVRYVYRLLTKLNKLPIISLTYPTIDIVAYRSRFVNHFGRIYYTAWEGYYASAFL